MADRLANAVARRVFLWLHGLCDDWPPGAFSRADLPKLVERIGFVQIDAIRTVERAHHHILLSRVRNYKPGWLDHHLELERTLFENWTHDASVIPMQFFPYWKPRFRCAHDELLRRPWWRERMGDDPDTVCRQVLDYVAEKGPVMARDLKTANTDPLGGINASTSVWWGWHPLKAALVFLWRTGRLAVSRRQGFQKVYDLTERVIPAQHLEQDPSDAEFLRWKCATALERMGFASTGEVARYWGGIRPQEAKSWSEGAGRNSVRALEIEDASGDVRLDLARPDLDHLAREVPDPPSRVRFLSPFDPVVRDRKRTKRLFGFDFRVEMFVPASKRQYGYYVYPILERDRLIGRIEIKNNREADTLDVLGLWFEPRIRANKSRDTLIGAELDRWRRHVGLAGVTWCGRSHDG